LNTNNLKKYAPQARRQFISAVLKRINELGVYSDTQIAESTLNGDIYSIEGRNFDKLVKPQRERLIAKVKNEGFLHLVEQVASTWFNRFCAIRFMELKEGYLEHGYRVLSHPKNPQGYEILDHAQDAAQDLGLNKEGVIELKLAANKDEELFRKLLLAQCHQLHIAMPFLFEALDDETELLLPQSLMRTDSILRGLVDDIPESDWLQVEVIGWLYQFYISEKKDQVMGNVVKSEDIPAATQLFTPDWIVQYLVQNSVARQWLEVNPNSNLIAKLKAFSKDKLVARAVADKVDQEIIDAIEGEEFYIEPAVQIDEVNAQLKARIPESIDPESIKVIDPACGSGHILIEAYNVLNFIYQEEGYVPRKIPQLILENNLFGLDIDDRAAQLTGFALMMMARKDDHRIFTRGIRLNALAVKESTELNISELWKNLDLDNKQSAGNKTDLFTMTNETDVIDVPEYKLLKQCKTWFLQADTLGSLIDIPHEHYSALNGLYNQLIELSESGNRVQIKAAKSILPFVHQAFILSQRYDSLIANPPYMGSKGMNSELKKFAKDHYPDSKSDLFAMFMEKAFQLLKLKGFNAQVNMQSWMFLSSFKALRKSLLSSKSIITMAHLGSRAFSQISGEVVQTTAWIIQNNYYPNIKPIFFNLTAGSEEQKRLGLARKINRFDNTLQKDFSIIPGSPIAFKLSDLERNTFIKYPLLETISLPKQGATTSDNNRFVRLWFEINRAEMNISASSLVSASESGQKWFPYNKGGEYRKWYGNAEYIVNYKNDGEDIKAFHEILNKTSPGGRLKNQDYYFKPQLSWSKIGGGLFSIRYFPEGSIFSDAGSALFPKSYKESCAIAGFLNSSVADYLLRAMSPTLNFEAEHIKKLPVLLDSDNNVDQLIKISKLDWDMYETSWDFIKSPFLCSTYSSNLLCEIFLSIKNDWKKLIDKTASLEKAIDDFVIHAYGVSTETKRDSTPFDNLTLTINPSFRYGSGKSEEDHNRRSQFDTLAELISYSVGCMMGRYSLNREGLVYANSGNDGFKSLVTEGAYKSFIVDDDGIIPLTDEEWFDDDATIRFRDFVKTVWGDKQLQENLEFVAESLCLNALKAKAGESPMATIRRYFSAQFYKDHLKSYKNRPIYWLFSSGKEKAFECAVYLHRYNEGTLSRIRTQYVTPLLGKQDARVGQLEQKLESASTSEATKLKRDIIVIEKKQAELRIFDDKLKHYADMRIPLNLDDGVKVNYGKFGDLLADVKKIHGKVVK
jgi:type II restriction/modification system DNA methylase subunit YeeA